MRIVRIVAPAVVELALKHRLHFKEFREGVEALVVLASVGGLVGQHNAVLVFLREESWRCARRDPTCVPIVVIIDIVLASDQLMVMVKAVGSARLKLVNLFKVVLHALVDHIAFAAHGGEVALLESADAYLA